MAKNEKEGMGCFGWIIVLVVCWIMYKYFIPSGGLLDNSAMEKPVAKAYEALASDDYDKYKAQFIDLSSDDMTNPLYYYDLGSYTQDYYDTTSQALKNEFGNEFEIGDIEVIKRQKYDVTELGDLSKIITAVKSEFTAITDIYFLDMNISISGTNKSDTYQSVAIVAKINWKWKCILIIDEQQLKEAMEQENNNDATQTSLE